MPATVQPESPVATDVRRPAISGPSKRTINVEVPDSVYWHIRKCAIESQLSMKDYMSRFCLEAFPYSPAPSNERAANSSASFNGQT